MNNKLGGMTMQSFYSGQQGIVECPVEAKKTVSQAEQKIRNTLWELEKSYDILDGVCKKRSSEMAQLETDMVTEIHRYQILIVLFGGFSGYSYWALYPDGTIGGGVGGGICLLLIALMLLKKRYQKKKRQDLTELQREDHESMRELQERMTKLREQLYVDKN